MCFGTVRVLIKCMVKIPGQARNDGMGRYLKLATTGK